MYIVYIIQYISIYIYPRLYTLNILVYIHINLFQCIYIHMYIYKPKYRVPKNDNRYKSSNIACNCEDF